MINLIALLLFLLATTFLCPSARAENGKITEDGKMNPPPKLAVVLGGGGARGAAHIGVLKVLEAHNIKPDLIVGNSMGALVGGLYAAGVPLSDIEEMFINGKIKKAFKPRPICLQVLSKMPMMPLKICKLKKKSYPGIYSGKAIEKFVNSIVPEDKKNIEDLNIPLAVVVTDLSNGQAYRMTKGNLAFALRASASLPPVIKPIEFEDRVLADGGLRANLPTIPARDMGAEYIVAVETDARMQKIDNKKLKKISGLMDRIASIGLSIIDEFHAQKADLVISPKIDDISVYEFTKENAHLAVRHGEEAAEKMLPQLMRFSSRSASLPQRGVGIE